LSTPYTLAWRAAEQGEGQQSKKRISPTRWGGRGETSEKKGNPPGSGYDGALCSALIESRAEVLETFLEGRGKRLQRGKVRREKDSVITKRGIPSPRCALKKNSRRREQPQPLIKKRWSGQKERLFVGRGRGEPSRQKEKGKKNGSERVERTLLKALLRGTKTKKSSLPLEKTLREGKQGWHPRGKTLAKNGKTTGHDLRTGVKTMLLNEVC